MGALENKNAWKIASKNEIIDFSKGYIEYLNNSKTERTCVNITKKNSRKKRI